jgi:hypothetical protein
MEPEMADEIPMVSCLCPTYRRPDLLANSLACFLMQDYPANARELIILDDAAEFRAQSGNGWELVSVNRRFRSLPEKYNALAGLARGKILVVWEDDDIYLPWHISGHVAALSTSRQFSKPSSILCHLNGQLQRFSASGRFHGSISFTRSALCDIRGWPLTLRGDFDQTFMGQLGKLGPVADPLSNKGPSYIFRGECTENYHGQSLMTGADDEDWYARAEQFASTSGARELVPRLDANTRHCCEELGVPISSP